MGNVSVDEAYYKRPPPAGLGNGAGEAHPEHPNLRDVAFVLKPVYGMLFYEVQENAV